MTFYKLGHEANNFHSHYSRRERSAPRMVHAHQRARRGGRVGAPGPQHLPLLLLSTLLVLLLVLSLQWY